MRSGAEDAAAARWAFENSSSGQQGTSSPLTSAQMQASSQGFGPLTPQSADEAVSIGEIADGAAKVDKMGQPLSGPSNYNAWKQFGKIMSEAGSDSLSTTAGKIWDWGTYTVPDADQRVAEYKGRDARWSQIDQMRESPLGAIGWGTSRLAGGSLEAQQMWLDIGTSADGLAMSAAALSARSPAFTGARGMPELASEPKLFEAYDRTRVGVEKEMFRTPGDELSIVISRDSGREVARQLVLGNGGQLNESMLDQMAGNTFTHFHPTGGNFSTSDVMTGLSYGAAEIRAVMSDRTVSMNFVAAPTNLVGNPGAVYEFMNSEQSAIGKAYRNGVSSGTLSPPSDPTTRGIWQSNFFVQQLVMRNSWIQYKETHR